MTVVLTERELDAMTRPQRVRALWAAIAPASRERIWAALSDDARVEVIQILFRAQELGPAGGDVAEQSAHASWVDRWQREADR